jgi:hypothetical protein
MNYQLVITGLKKDLPANSDSLLEQHENYFKVLNGNNKFLIAGTGDFSGIKGIYVMVTSKEESEDLMKNEPIYMAGYGSYSITEIDTVYAYPGLEKLLNNPNI